MMYPFKKEKKLNDSKFQKLKKIGFNVYYWVRPFYHYLDLASDLIVLIDMFQNAEYMSYEFKMATMLMSSLFLERIVSFNFLLHLEKRTSRIKK